MLRFAAIRLRLFLRTRSIRFVRASVQGACDCIPLADCGLIAAGLADPFITARALESIRRSCAAGSMFFLTLPQNEWAAVERRTLGIPDLSNTRFRLVTGEVREVSSYTYSDAALRELLTQNAFSVVSHGLLRHEPGSDDHQRLHRNPPAVTYFLCRAV